MPPTTGYSFGDIVLVAFPFTNQLASKKRPAVVVSTTAYHQARPDVILMAVTSQLRRTPGFGEVVLQDWRSAGLLKPSAVKPVVFTAEKRIVLKRLGQLTSADRKAVKEAIARVIG